MKVEVDDRSGFCFGVVRAIRLAGEAVAEHERVSSLGDIVHNRVEMERLGALGLESVSHERMKDMAGHMVLIRAHGEPPATYRLAERYNIGIVDATCPVVARLQKIVAEASRAMLDADGQVVILGKKGHAEVIGLTGQADTLGRIIVIEKEADLDAVDFTRPVYLLSQTTQSLALFGKVAAEIMRRAVDPAQVTVHDTICRQVADRDPLLRVLAARHDVIIFVSGRKSSNGRALFEACRDTNPHSHMVEDENELREEWFAGAESVGVCGATSTPRWLMDRVARAVERYAPDTGTQEG